MSREWMRDAAAADRAKEDAARCWVCSALANEKGECPNGPHPRVVRVEGQPDELA